MKLSLIRTGRASDSGLRQHAQAFDGDARNDRAGSATSVETIFRMGQSVDPGLHDRERATGRSLVSERVVAVRREGVAHSRSARWYSEILWLVERRCGSGRFLHHRL